MAIVRIITRHVDRPTYDRINERVDLEHEHPLGLIVHGAGEVDGAMRVVQVWDSEEYALRYEEDTLKPAYEAAGVPFGGDIDTTPLDYLVTP